MDYQNPLDQMIQRFQYRWETDRQYRAAMSGVFGLLLIVVLVSGVGVLDLTASRVLAAVGFQAPGASGGNSGQHNTDTGVVVGDVRQFPTPTVPTWASQATPLSSPLAASGTPFPTPTPTVTPTDAPTTGPCTSNCGGGGPRGSISGTYSPAQWVGNEPDAAISVKTSSPNVLININLTYPHGQTYLSATDPGAPQRTGADSTAVWRIGARPQGLPSSGCTGGGHITVTIAADFGGMVYGPGLSIPCS